MSDQEDKERPTRTVMLYGARARRRDKQEWDMRPVEVSPMGALKISLVDQNGQDIAVNVSSAGTNFAGGGTGVMSTIGKLSAQLNTIAIPTTFSDLHSYTLPANSLNLAGRGVRARWWGVFNSATTTYNLTFGSLSTNVATNASFANGTWIAELFAFRIATLSQAVFFNFMFAASGTLVAPLVTLTSANSSENEATDIIIKSRGNAAAGGGNNELGMVVEFLN